MTSTRRGLVDRVLSRETSVRTSPWPRAAVLYEANRVTALRTLLRGAALLVFLGAGVWGAILMLGPSHSWFSEHVGFFAVPAMLVLAPVLFGLGPFYFALAQGWWLPLIVLWGGALAAFGLFALSVRRRKAIDRDHRSGAVGTS